MFDLVCALCQAVVMTLKSEFAAALGGAGERHKAARLEEAAARESLRRYVVDALRGRLLSINEIAELSGYTRQRLNQIAADEGVDLRGRRWQLEREPATSPVSAS